MTVKLCRDGKEVGLREAVDYLERRYGIPSGHMRMVSVTGEVGAPIAITVVVFMQQDEPAKPASRKLIGPVHAHQDAPCTDACYEPAAKPEPLRGNVQPLDAGEVGEVPEGWTAGPPPEREPEERICQDHGAGCTGWPRHEGWKPSELDA